MKFCLGVSPAHPKNTRLLNSHDLNFASPPRTENFVTPRKPSCSSQTPLRPDQIGWEGDRGREHRLNLRSCARGRGDNHREDPLSGPDSATAGLRLVEKS